jgi:hypothetical protein
MFAVRPSSTVTYWTINQKVQFSIRVALEVRGVSKLNLCSTYIYPYIWYMICYII